MIDLDTIYENLDKMAELKRYKQPTKGYFPSLAEINGVVRSKEYPYILEYLLWLDECLTDPEDRKIHKEAIARLREVVAEMDEEEEVYGGDYTEVIEEEKVAEVVEKCEEKIEEKAERKIIYLDGYVEED